MTEQAAAPPATETEAPQLTVSVEELAKTHNDLKKRSRFWMSALGGTVLTSIGASYCLHPAAGVLAFSLYLVLFAHSNLVQVTDALKQTNHAQALFNACGEDAINQQIAAQFGRTKKNSDTKPSGQYL